MAPVRSLQGPRADPRTLSNNPSTVSERKRRSNLDDDAADYERQKKADWQNERAGLEKLRRSKLYQDLTTDAAKARMEDVERARLRAKRIAKGNHHSLMKGHTQRPSLSSKKIKYEPGPDDAPSYKDECDAEDEERRQREEKKIKEEKMEKQIKEEKMRHSTMPKIKQEDDDDFQSAPWVMGNAGLFHT